MTEAKITPEKITKPIQLLAAWLAGLFSINSSFLVAATNMAPRICQYLLKNII